jgi:hypothetical protein
MLDESQFQLGNLGREASRMLSGNGGIYTSVMGRVHLGDLETDGRVILQCVSEKKVMLIR